MRIEILAWQNLKEGINGCNFSCNARYAPNDYCLHRV